MTVNVGETSTVAACFNDANGDVLTYTATSSNPSVATASLAGTSITVTAIAPGNTTVTVTASDPGGLQGQSNFGVMVPNRAPQPQGTVPNVTVRVGRTATVDASQYFTEPDGQALTYTAASSDPEVASASAAGSTITVAAEAKGGANITITASDPGGLSATQSFRLTVPNRPPAPVGGIGAQTIEVGQSVTLDVAGSFSDPDGDILTYTAASSIAAVARTSVSGSSVTITAAGPGTAVITITARDDDQATAIQQVSVTVPQPNRAPRRVGSIPAQTIEVGGRATVNASRYFSDPDGDALTYSASSSNASVARASVSGSTVTITGASAGSATVTVTARDPDGLTATQTARVTVSQANRAPRPVGTIPSQTITAGGRTTVNASTYFNDPDGDALTYSASSSNASVARVSVSGSTVTVTGSSTGSATITVTARDPGGLSATQRFSVTVGSAGAPDLEFTSVTPTSVNASPGETVRATFTLQNSGNATAAATTIRVYQSNNSTISTSDTEIGRGQTSSLAAGRSRTITGTVTLSSQASGTFYFGLCADAVSGESDTGNNCSRGVRVTVGSSGAPDLEWTNVTPTSLTGSPGETVRAEFTLRNSGDAAAAPTTLRVYQSSNSSISTSDTELGSRQISSLAAGRSLRVNQGIILASGASGTFYFGLCVDAVSGESDTDNNCSRGVRVTVGGSGAPDLVVSVSRSSVTVAAGSSFTYDVTVRNQGDGRSAATLLRLFQSDNATISTGDTQIGNPTNISALAPSGETTGTRTITITPGSSGTTYIGDCVDAVSGESDTNNNCSSAIQVNITSSSSIVAEPQWNGRMQVTRTEMSLNRSQSDEAAAARLVAGVILRVKPGTEPEESGDGRGAILSATIHIENRREP